MKSPHKIFLLLLLLPEILRAYHIAGADFSYRHLGGYNYELSYTLYRDCSNDGSGLPVADFDDVIYFFVFENNTKRLYKTVTAGKPRDIIFLDPEAAEKCIYGTPTVCIQVGTYKARVTLPPRPGGYTVIWQRCCRNLNVTNLTAPEYQGATFLVNIPGSDTYSDNSSPVFKNYPPLFLCIDRTLYFDHSAVDADGDSLVYRLGNPLNGINYLGQGVDYNDPVADLQNPAGPPPYVPVTFAPGYSFAQPFGANAVCKIDSVTGLLEIRPTQFGLYALAIDVLEYRNGKLLGATRREIQFYVADCLPPGPPLQISHTFPPDLTVIDDTVFILANKNMCYEAQILANPAPQGNIHVFPHATSLGLTNLNISVYGQQPTIVNTCWQTSCDKANQILPFIIEAYDDETCYYYTKVYDTVYVKILAPPTDTPTVSLTPVNFSNGDTVWFGDTVCMHFSIRSDTLVSEDFEFLNIQSNPPNITVITKTDTLIEGTICWETGCSAVLNPATFIVKGINLTQCNTPFVVADTLQLYVKLPENPRPNTLIYPDTSTVLFFEAGTPVVYASDTVCFKFFVTDASPPSNLQYQIEVYDQFGNLFSQPDYDISILQNQGDTLIEGRLCLEANCKFLNRTITIVFKTLDYGKCSLNYLIVDSLKLKLISKPVFPINISWNAGGHLQIGDTVFVKVREESCINITLTDTLNPQGDLFLRGEGDLFDGIPPDAVFLQQNGQVILETQICFNPHCIAYDTLLTSYIIGRSQPHCRDSVLDTTTVFVRIIQPENRPPTITRDIPSPYPVEINQKICYSLLLEDPDDKLTYQIGKLGEAFRENFGYGSNATLIKTDTLSPNRYLFTICLTPNCYVNEKDLQLTFCIEDTTTCDTVYTVCDELILQAADCGLIMPNVFTPNGDGINEVFEPSSMEGIKEYELFVFDRWGRQLFYGKNEGWKPEASISEGVYFYKILFKFYNGTGPEWLREQTGSFSLLR